MASANRLQFAPQQPGTTQQPMGGSPGQNQTPGQNQVPGQNPAALNALSQSAPKLQPAARTPFGNNAATASSTPGAGAGPDPTAFTFTDANNAKADKATQGAADTYNGTGAWAKQAALNAMSNSVLSAGERSARSGYSPFGAASAAANSQGLVNGINAMNSQMASWAQGSAQLQQNAAAGYRNQAQFTANGQNATNAANTQTAQNNLNNQQASNAAAQTASVQSATNLYDAQKGWSPRSSAAQAWGQAQTAYSQAQASGDQKAIQAAIAQMNAIGTGSNYTADGHSRSDPALKDRVADAYKVKQKDGSTIYFDKGSKKAVATQSADGTFTYQGK